ncbi:MAG TPA: 23S rRNA (pseudouridine(1915)-N(3))-methyltransferase RlmH [Legionellales bacterium]|nr:23S rRNA (pseudouridine(1915)-N(3))-methyltransferase RlmH [Legionellales bacterium]
MLKITICCIGQKMPKWVDMAHTELSKRLERKIQVEWIEIPLIKRTASTHLSQILEKEYQLLLDSIPPKAHIICLDAKGKNYSSEGLADRMKELQQIHSHWCIVIGGPEGLHPALKEKASEMWSLSSLTFPHPLVRLILLESLYRSWCILNNHPYHK